MDNISANINRRPYVKREPRVFDPDRVVLYGTFRYTDKEMTVRNKTISQAIESARLILKEKHNVTDVNVKSAVNRDLSEQITMKELNEVSSQIIRDTLSSIFAN